MNKAEELKLVYEIDKIRDKAKNFKELLNSVAQKTKQKLKAKFVAISIYTEKYDNESKEFKKSFEIKATTEKFVQRKYINYFKKIIEKTYKEFITSPQVTSYIKTHPDIDGKNVISTDLLYLHEMVIGAIQVVKSSALKKSDLELLTAIGSQLDSAIWANLLESKIKDAFSKYVNESVMNTLLAKPQNEYIMGNYIKSVTVLFADIRSSTKLIKLFESEPFIIVKFLNDLLGNMAEIVIKNNGTVVDFIGDEIMAVFGAPLQMEESLHTKLAIETSLEMRKRLLQIRKKWGKYGENFKNLEIGISINSGPVIAGNIGSERHFIHYTTIGTTVNIAHRIQNYFKEDKNVIGSELESRKILIAESTYRILHQQGIDKLLNIDIKSIGKKRIRGIESKEIEIFQVNYRK